MIFSYQYVLEYVKVAGPGCLSMSLSPGLAPEPGTQKRGTASAEDEKARSAVMVGKLRILRRF